MKPQPIPVRILIVDDDAMFREVLSVLLEGEGYAVECADSGDAALALLAGGGHTPEIVLADMQMPGTTGTQLADELRHACGPVTCLLAMSASQPPEEEVSRFDGFLMKPFAMDRIAAAMLARSRRSDAIKVSAKRKRREVASGPGKLPSTTKVVSIHALSKASNSGMDTQVRESPYAYPVPDDSNGGRPALNETIYSKLADSMSAQQLRDLYAMCVNDARGRISVMRGLVAAGDAVRFAREAHSIKGGCGMLGATELYGMAAALETAGLEMARIEGAQKITPLDDLLAACDRLERILESRC